MAVTEGAMGEQQVECATAATWYTVRAPATASTFVIEAQAAGRWSVDASLTGTESVAAWGAAGVRGFAIAAGGQVVGDVPSHRLISVSSDGGSSRALIAFTDEVE